METMSKTTETTKNTEFATFDPAKTADQFRAVAEQGVVQSKEALAKFNTDAERTQKALQSSFENAKTVGSELSLRTITTLRANAQPRDSHLARTTLFSEDSKPPSPSAATFHPGKSPHCALKPKPAFRFSKPWLP